MSVNVVLLNTPMVNINGIPVVFPYRKAEALFYYLAVKKQATRDELGSILWGDMDEENAKKNLRHSMYKLKKAFGMDIIISPQRSMIKLNPKISMDIDVDRFMGEGQDGLEVYKGEFLKGFYVKDSQDFEAWVRLQRDYYKTMFTQKLYKRIESALKEGDSKIEQFCKILIAEDPFDERAYRALMKVYAQEGAFSKVVDTYKQLKEVLQEELGISPHEDSQSLYHDIMTIQDFAWDKSEEVDKFFYGRRKELSRIKLLYDSFVLGNPFKSVLIVGEAGIGKTRLKDYFIKTMTKGVCVLESNCYQAEEEYFLKPWNNIFEKLAEIIHREKIEIPTLWKNVISYVFPIFETGSHVANINPVEKIEQLKYQVAEEAIIGVLKKISIRIKLVLVFDDLQWMDPMSLKLLGSVLLRQVNVFLITTCRNGYGERMDNFITSMGKYDVIERIDIRRFNKNQVEEFVKQGLPSHPWSKDLVFKIYRETEGNTFFLVEIINAIKEHGDVREMSSKTQDIIKSRFWGLSDNSMKIVNIASHFFDKFSLDVIRKLGNKDELEIVEIMENLQKRYIIKEIDGGENIYYEFTHQKLRDYIYINQSLARKKVLHNRIGKILEEDLKHNSGDRFIYPKLIYHFKNGGNPRATIKYMIKNLDNYFDLSHEMFPVLVDGNNYYQMNNGEAVGQLNEIETLFNDLRVEEKQTHEMKTLEIAFLHMKGRYLIYIGQYKEGTDCINKMISRALEIEDWIYGAKGYRQMIYYCIQTHNILQMKENLDKGIELANIHGLKKEMGILLRLKGLYETMDGQYERAEETLKESIAIFEAINQHEDRYALNIAAGYNYIGEIRRYNMKFNSALQYYDKAMKICKSKDILRGLSIFNSHAGQTALDMGDYLRAENYLKKAIKHYEQMDTLWGRSTAEGYLALVQVKNGKYSKAIKHLKNAEKYAKKLKSPYEMGLVYRVKAEIKASMKKNTGIKEVFKEYLYLELEDYCDEGIKLLEEVKESYEVDILKVLKKNKG